MRRLISSGSSFESDVGYSRAVVDGEWVFVAGTTGFDYSTMTLSDDVAEQCEQTLKNIEAALAEAGASFADVVRVQYILPKPRRLSGLLAGAQARVWRCSSCSHDVRCRPSQRGDEDRNRGHCQEIDDV